MRALINLLLNLPWWGSLLVLGGLAALAYGFGLYFRFKFHQTAYAAVIEAGATLRDANVAVHAVTPVPAPDGASPYDLSPEDEEYTEGVDDLPWDNDGANYYAIDATITPTSPDASWDPTGLALVPADFTPDDPIEVSDRMCPLHSAQILVDGQFQPAREGAVFGPQRVKLVFAVHDGLRSVKLASLVTYFGHIDLPAPLPKVANPVMPRKAASKWGL